MDFALTEQQIAIEENVARICRQFGDEYWTECDGDARFPHEFHRAMADGGWLGITMPEELGGAGLGVLEAAIMMQTRSLCMARGNRRPGFCRR
jgi:acyl-CoA dehydrogenase